MKTKNEICISDLSRQKLYSYEKPECEVVLLNSEGLICTSGGDEKTNFESIVNGYEDGNKYDATLGW